jgi:outer membrane protein assembly factor BamE
MHPSPLGFSSSAHGLGAWRRALLTLGLLGLGASLTACSSLGDQAPAVTRLVTPHQVDIQQGNVVTREQVQLLKPGASKAMVRDLLGSPLLTSVFHADRWDYVFTFKRQGQALQQRKLALFFKGDVLERVEADALPSEAEFVASLDARRSRDRQPALQATEEQLKDFQARNAVSAAPAAPVAAPAVSYPPLETPGASR